MSNLFVPYETAKQLKEKGFDEPCFRAYDTCECLYFSSGNTTGYIQNKNLSTAIAAPTYQQVVEWFIDKHELSIEITFLNMAGIDWVGWDYTIVHMIDKNETPVDADFGTMCGAFKNRNDAFNIGIEEAIKLI